MKDYRPISCCNVLYKVISKILANRLKEILPKIISQNQSAFVKERLLMENVLLATELVKDYHKESMSTRCAMKIDISKAFDSIQWSFLLNTLAALNFPEKFIHWIKLCITTASFSVQVNGELAGYFGSSRGVRQGCSLSPYLFVICINVLSRMIDREAEERRIGYHPKCQKIALTHLCFADDLMVFVDGRKRSIDGVLAVFKEFEKVSGLMISLEKSIIYLGGVTNNKRAAIASSLPLPIGNLPITYLGLPLLSKRMTVSDYMPLVEKVRHRFKSWTGRFLSYAGRLQLISSVIMSLLNFWMLAFRLPSGFLKDIQGLCSAFLWSGPDLNPKKAKISWMDICKPKIEGGLGVKSLVYVNKTSCLKLVWRLLSKKGSLWVDWIWKHIIRGDSFWSVKESSSLGSWMWKKLLKYRKIARRFHKVEVRNGNDISFWFDNWSELGRIIDITGDRGTIDLGIQISASLSSVLQANRRKRHRSESLISIEQEITKARQSFQLHGANDENDLHVWLHRQDRYKPKFTTKDTWHLIRLHHPLVQWSKGIWFSNATSKFSFLAWTALHKRLPTGNRLHSWNPSYDACCMLCNTREETIEHLFFSCDYSSKIWKSLIYGLLRHEYTEDWDSIIRIISTQSQNQTKLFLIRYTFQATMHYIWRERNERKHGTFKSPPERLMKLIDKTIINRISSIQDSSTRLRDGLSTWFASRTP